MGGPDAMSLNERSSWGADRYPDPDLGTRVRRFVARELCRFALWFIDNPLSVDLNSVSVHRELETRLVHDL